MFRIRWGKWPRVLTQISGNNFVVLKASPPLVVTYERIDQFFDGATEAAALARGVMNI
jgi:acetylornithine/succinyldiaminopimelate/putrescine aminotransferase